MEENHLTYCSSMDESVVALNYAATFMIEVDKEQREKNQRLNCLSTREKVQRIWQMIHDEKDLKDIFLIEKLWQKPCLRKSWAEAERLRKIGNKKFVEGLLKEALMIYNKALCFLPDEEKGCTKNLFPLIVSNRSQVLFEMGSYRQALQVRLLFQSGERKIVETF